MRTGISALVRSLHWRNLIGLACLVVLMSGCSSTATTATTPGSTTTSTSTATVASATPTTATASGVCNTADFPPPIRQGPANTGGDPGPFYGGPISDFAFPAGTYYYDRGAVTGQHDWYVCSPGDPTTILTFMDQSISASAWMVFPPQGQSLAAQKPEPAQGVTTPVYCATLAVTVGGFPGYPGEWSFVTYSPVSTCR